MASEELPEYLIAARAYCRVRFSYYPHSYHGGIVGAAAALEHDAAGVAGTPWFRAVVDAAVGSALARTRRARRDARGRARAARWARAGRWWRDQFFGSPPVDEIEPPSTGVNEGSGSG